MQPRHRRHPLNLLNEYNGNLTLHTKLTNLHLFLPSTESRISSKALLRLTLKISIIIVSLNLNIF